MPFKFVSTVLDISIAYIPAFYVGVSVPSILCINFFFFLTRIQPENDLSFWNVKVFFPELCIYSYFSRAPCLNICIWSWTWFCWRLIDDIFSLISLINGSCKIIVHSLLNACYLCVTFQEFCACPICLSCFLFLREGFIHPPLSWPKFPLFRIHSTLI